MISTSRISAFALSVTLAGLSALGYLAPKGAQAQPASRGAVPRFVYGPGNAGFGYYNYSVPATPPAAAPASGPTTRTFSVPASGRASTGNSRGRDWSTGRRMTIAKPWLRPMD